MGIAYNFIFQYVEYQINILYLPILSIIIMIMEITLENTKIESSRVSITGQTSTVKVQGVVNVDGNGKVTQADGSFFRVSDNVSIGNFSSYGTNNKSFNGMTDDSLTCDCMQALSTYITAIENTTPSSIKL